MNERAAGQRDTHPARQARSGGLLGAAMTHHYRLLPIIVAAILGMGAAAGVLAWVTWQWTERGK